jgi:hypothetical protein
MWLRLHLLKILHSVSALRPCELGGPSTTWKQSEDISGLWRYNSNSTAVPCRTRCSSADAQ